MPRFRTPAALLLGLAFAFAFTFTVAAPRVARAAADPAPPDDDSGASPPPSPNARARATGLYLAIAGGAGLVPVGNANRQLTLAPIAIEIGRRSAAGLEVGGLGELAPSVGGDCEPQGPYGSGSCAGWRARVGFRARAHFVPTGPVDPWVGTGFAVDVLYAPGYATADNHAPLWGFSLPHTELGVDLHAGDHVVVGPYVAADLGVWAGTFANRAAPEWASNSPSWALAAGARVAYGGL